MLWSSRVRDDVHCIVDLRCQGRKRRIDELGEVLGGLLVGHLIAFDRCEERVPSPCRMHCSRHVSASDVWGVVASTTGCR